MSRTVRRRGRAGEVTRPMVAPQSPPGAASICKVVDAATTRVGNGRQLSRIRTPVDLAVGRRSIVRVDHFVGEARKTLGTRGPQVPPTPVIALDRVSDDRAIAGHLDSV